MANILQVTTPNLNAENRNILNTQDPRQGANQAVRNPVDPTRVVRADGRDGQQAGNTTKDAAFNVIEYESNYGAFIKKLGEENRYDYGRILLGMVTQEEGSFRMLPDSLRHAGLCNTEMADTKKHMERRIRKLTAMPKKSTIIVTFTLLLGLMAFSYVFIGKEEQDSLFWELSSRNHTEQGEVMITQSDLPDGKVSDEVLSYVENMAEVSIP